MTRLEAGDTMKRALDPRPDGGKRQRARDGFTLATDFSGLETVGWALKILQVGHRQVFGSDLEKCSRSIMEHLGVERILKDISEVSAGEKPSADVYFFGPPCQCYSPSGKREGVEDSKGRGVIVLHSLTYISVHKPRLVIMEEVPEFASDSNAEMRDLLLNTLQNDYDTKTSILVSSDFGVPQQRRRFYVVAVRKDLASYGGFHFPAPKAACPSLEDFLERLPDSEFQMLPAEPRARDNVLEAVKPLLERGVNIYEQAFLVPMGVSSGRAKAGPLGRAPTVIRTDAGRGYWCCWKGGPLTADELARLQGFPDGMVPYKDLGVSERQYKLMLGNAMTLVVVLHLLPPALYAAGLLNKSQHKNALKLARDFQVYRKE